MRVVGARADRRRHTTARGRAPPAGAGARADPLDADTAAKRGALQEALERFAEADRAVLVGTQMVAKGHHFPGVSLAAVVDADTGLALPDFRAEERTFQLVTQLAGRSGRDAPGKVIVQSFQPDATPLRYAARHDVAGFLAEELERRRELGYPPFRHLLSIVASGPDAVAPERLLRELNRGLGETCSGRRRCSACGEDTGRSSSRRRIGRARSPRGPRSCSPRRPRRCGKRASRRSSTSTRSRSDCGHALRLHSRGCRRRVVFVPRTSLKKSARSTARPRRAVASPSHRSASIRTPSCACVRARWSRSTTTSPGWPRR